MQTNGNLEKQAIRLALSQNWEEAITINKDLLDKVPTDIKAKIRLGTCYLQLKRFSEAEKVFKEVLKQDPINSIAKKNIDLAKAKKVLNIKANGGNGKSLIKEPGTSIETEVTITAKGITSNAFSHGDSFDLKYKRDKTILYSDNIEIATIEDKVISKKLASRNKVEMRCQALFVRGDGKKIKVLIRCSEPIFKGDKQDVKPYLKKGSIETPEMEVESFDDE